MSKIDLLFDGTTIINFPFYIKLLKRYKRSVLLLLFILLSASIAAYALQQDVYETAISFSDISNNSSDPSLKALSAFMGEDKKSNKSAEILNLRTSMDFTTKVAENLVRNKNFELLNLDLSFFGKKSNSILGIIKFCKKNNECISKEIKERLPKFYEIADRDRTGVNFSLHVKTTDELTSKVLLSEIKASITEQRIESLKNNILQQENVNADMVKRKKKDLESLDYYGSEAKKNKIENELKNLESNIEFQDKLITEIQSSLASAESKFKRSKTISKKKINRDGIDLEKKSKDLKEKIEKLSSDIHFLENSNSNETVKDKEIIANLKSELKDSKARLDKLGFGNSNMAFDQFIKNNEDKAGNIELDYGILVDQEKTTKKNRDFLIAQKNELFEKKQKLSQKLEQSKPTIDFLNVLEAKVQQLNLLRTTIVTDMSFDTYETPPEPVKKIGKILFTAYYIVLNFILISLFLTCRYFWDENIYDEADLRMISDDLEIIGIGPQYTKK